MTDLSRSVSTSDIFEIFGSEIAGNHVRLATDAEGWILCRCDGVELNGLCGSVFFEMDEMTGNWNVMSMEDSAKAVKLARSL